MSVLMHALGKFVSEELGADVPVNLLPYHRLGEGKAENLGKEVQFSADVPSDEHMNRLKSIVESYGLAVKIGG